MSADQIKCPGCGREVEFVFNPEGQDVCPHCGSPPLASELSTKFNWLIFLGVLFAPAVLTLVGELVGADGLAVIPALLGSVIVGPFCGIYLARHVGRTSAARLWLGCLFVGVFGCVSLTLSFIGCMLGGFNPSG